MPDQYGRITGRDWLGLAGAISNIDTMRRGREYLGMRRAEEKRKATLFEQGQRDRAKRMAIQEDVANQYIQSGIINQQGQITPEGYKMLANPQFQRRDVAIKTLKKKGKDAFAYLKANTEFTGQLLSNATNQKNLQMLALDKANQNYEKIEGLLKAAQIEEGRGQPNKAAQYIANAIEDGMMRKHARAVGDKIEVWEVVNGIKQPSDILTVQEALLAAQDYTRENYTPQASAHIVAGYEQNKNPKIFNLKTPKGKSVKAVQIFRSGKVDYLFFNQDGSVYKKAPKDLEQAYSKGWMPEDEKAAADLALTKAKTEKIRAEKEKIEKSKAEKPMTADEARKRLADLAKFESSLNKTGGWNETVFELMAKKDPEFAKSALTINSSKKKVRETIKKLREYYESLIPEFTPKSFGPSDAPEGTTATNPDTGEKIITKNGEWILLE